MKSPGLGFGDAIPKKGEEDGDQDEHDQDHRAYVQRAGG